jgi:hypothetical protein
MTYAPTRQRGLVHTLSLTQPEKALSVARSIDDPWFRCQALSNVARHWPHKEYEPILCEAIKAADAQERAYRRVAVSAWPIAAYLERGNNRTAATLLKKYTEEARQIDHMGGRCEALMRLFGSARAYNPSLWKPVFYAILDAAEPSISWRQGRAVVEAAKMILADHRELVRQAASQLSYDRHRSALTKLLAQSDPQIKQPATLFSTDEQHLDTISAWLKSS